MIVIINSYNKSKIIIALGWLLYIEPIYLKQGCDLYLIKLIYYDVAANEGMGKCLSNQTCC